MYAADYEVFTPCRALTQEGAGPYWCGLGKGSTGNDVIDFTSEQGYLTPYLKKAGIDSPLMQERSSNVFFCPDASVAQMLDGKTVTNAPGGGYATNGKLHGTGNPAALFFVYPLYKPWRSGAWEFSWVTPEFPAPYLPLRGSQELASARARLPASPVPGTKMSGGHSSSICRSVSIPM